MMGDERWVMGDEKNIIVNITGQRREAGSQEP
jgi:hypothetical protein